MRKEGRGKEMKSSAIGKKSKLGVKLRKEIRATATALEEKGADLLRVLCHQKLDRMSPKEIWAIARKMGVHKE